MKDFPFLIGASGESRTGLSPGPHACYRVATVSNSAQEKLQSTKQLLPRPPPAWVPDPPLIAATL